MRTTRALSRLARSRLRAARNSTGAVLVEASLCLLVVAIFSLGAAEYGNLFASTVDVSGSVRSATRAAAATGSTVTSDYQIIQAAIGRGGGVQRSIGRIVIYDATTHGEPSTACKTGTPPQADCNIYFPADFSNPSATGGNGWPADGAHRVPGVSLVGVYMDVRRTPLEKLVWSPDRFSDSMVMRIEPIVNAAPTPGASGWSAGTTGAPPWQDSWKCWTPSCGDGDDGDGYIPGNPGAT